MNDIDQRVQNPRRMIGRPRDSPTTPALILDLPKVRSNIAEMATRMSGVHASLRPHAKIHKSPILGQMQLDAGGIGLTTATVWEAGVMIDAGLGDVLVANEAIGPGKAAEAARAAGAGRLTLSVESEVNVRELSQAAEAAGSVINVIIEVDVGQHRCGVRSAQEGVELGKLIESLPGLELQGVLGYEGHCMLEPDRELRITKAREANQVLLDTVDELDRNGLNTSVVAGGGLGTWDITGANPRITEIHAGSYIFSDAFHRNLVPGFEPALTVLSTIISRHDDIAVLDCGRKSIGIDRAPPEVVGGDAVLRVEYGEYFIHEEHTGIQLLPGSTLDVGDRVELMPGYSPTTVNFYDIFYVAEDGVITDVWPITARYGSATSGVV